MTESLVQAADGRCELSSPVAMPRASGFLFNRNMMMQVNCRGFVTAQHMQPEPAKYAHPPLMEAGGFMQPEQPYFAHHPGRFFYIKDEESAELFSAPYEPVRKAADCFRFSVGQGDIRWTVEQAGLEARMLVSLPVDDALELWSFEIRNTGTKTRSLSVYPFFTIGYMSWMNQSAAYRPDLGGIVASSISGYQKLEDYEKVRRYKDLTFLLHDTPPDAWETMLEAFEGEGGLHAPDGIAADQLSNGEAIYETPAALLQYRLELEPGETRRFRFLFGPARDDREIAVYRDRYLAEGGFEKARDAYRRYLGQGESGLHIKTPDSQLNHFVNGWLGRQVFYHGSTHRLSTDPQTRNFLQDSMGMAYLQPRAARDAFLLALAQQESDGALPDGIRLTANAELKYINQVPHSDHCVWLPLGLQAYLDETGDYGLLEETVESEAAPSRATVFERVNRAMQYLLDSLDHRKLSLIAQGDWCDPMNMAGYKGKGVSGWLSIATVHALRTWAGICRQADDEEKATAMLNVASEITDAIQEQLWDGRWFARGITDEGRLFGVSTDQEGRIFLNPQSWALMADIADDRQGEAMIGAIEEQLETPHGVMMLAPAFTHMHEDIGRVTQKFPGSAENGSIYNHAATFYVHALFLARRPSHAYRLLRQMIPGPDQQDLLRRGQLPVFIPNYYRGAADHHPRTAGRSSQLFNTGTASWFYRILVEQLFGLKGCREGLRIEPQLPGGWKTAAVERKFRGALFKVSYSRGPASISVNGLALEDKVIRNFEAGKIYRVEVMVEEELK